MTEMMELEMTASGGLAPARCPGLIASLRPPRLAAPGAGHDVTPATAEQKFVVAREALRVARCRARTHGAGVRAAWSRTGGECAAPGTLHLGGVVLRRGAPRRCATRRPPRCAPDGAYEAAHAAACSANDGVEAAARRAMMMDQDYELVHIVARLAPSFGRTRGRLRGAAGSSLEWPASRMRVSLVEAEEAEATARCAWRASEWSLGMMACECGQVQVYARDVQVELDRLMMLRAMDAAASRCRASSEEEHARGQVVAAVRDMAVAAASTLARVQAVLDRYYWGVWGSARRLKASAREIDVLTAALREAEWGAGDNDLPGGSTWVAAFGALGEAGAQMGGGGVAVGDVAVGNDGSAGDGADVGVGGCEACGDITKDGRQAADGDHVADLWRGRTSGPRGWRL